MTPTEQQKCRWSFMLNYIWIGLGGAVGTIARFWLNGVISRHFETFPMGTLVINVTGSFVIGFFASLTDPAGRYFVSPAFRQFFMIGVCGGYTTFSSFSLQTLELARAGQWLQAGAYTVLSVICCLAAVWAGHSAAAFINSLKGQ